MRRRGVRYPRIDTVAGWGFIVFAVLVIAVFADSLR